MRKVTPAAPFSTEPVAPAQADTASATTTNMVPSSNPDANPRRIVDGSTLLYQPALRAAVAQEQTALLATRLAVARWTSGDLALPAPPDAARLTDAAPFRAAFYARAQEDFFAWIGRGGVWETCTSSASQSFSMFDC